MNYEIATGTAFGDFSSLTGWTTSGTSAVDTSIFKTGSASIKLTAVNGGNSHVTRTINDDLNRNNIHGIWVYIVDTSVVADLIIYLSNDSGFTNYYSRTITNSNTRIYNGWNYIVIRKEDWSATGSPSWGTTFVRTRCRVTATSGNDAIAYFDSYFLNPYSRPKIMFTFDDVYQTAYTVGFPYLRSKGLKATFYACGALAGTSSFLTREQLQDVYANGFDVANHTYSHPHLDLSTNDEIIYQLKTNDQWLRDNGFLRGVGHAAYPYGGYNDTVINFEKGLQMKTARTSDLSARYYQLHGKGLFNPFALKVVGVNQNQSLATMKAWVDTTIQTGGTCIFVFHDLVASAVAATEWNITDFQDLVDYIVRRQNVIDVVTISEWYNGLTTSRRPV
jgi:peptidoglycan/xylan/chitin deacetylase (PgdA/CDA1 family)